MERDIKKCVDEYERKYFGTKSAKGKFYLSDLEGIVEKSGGLDDIYHLIYYALEAGFVVGYKCAKRENRRQLKTVKVG